MINQVLTPELGSGPGCLPEQVVTTEAYIQGIQQTLVSDTTDSHSHSDGGFSHAWRQPAHQEQLW